MKQLTSNLLMIEPVAFRFNEETAKNNFYQKHLDTISADEVKVKALAEFNDFVNKLRNHGVNVHVFKDTIKPDTPDSIFPNNWVSFHQDGRIALYPMCAENRRLERRTDILETLRNDFEISSIVDFSHYELEDLFMEGTGSMILDRETKICYAAISIRTDENIANEFCDEFGYELVSFTANQTHNGERLAIYHTNVMMCVADKYAIVCMDTIDNIDERNKVTQSLISSGKEVIEITEAQKGMFAGNMLQVMGHEPLLVMSSSAFSSLTKQQIEKIQAYNPILHSSLDTIEACGGGSARCMMAEVFLPSRN
ncbi:MAG: arginine deiminase-related protein [Crocinitomicaceae bacterium]|nr:arginine deiminase-related protein [Crocinitomicaceae bacterium]MDG2505136.1 arginine deiminase-related protein [Crocinitomicaceae bacterium]